MNKLDQQGMDKEYRTTGKAEEGEALYLLAIAQLPIEFTGPTISLEQVHQLASSRLAKLSPLQIDILQFGALVACYKRVPRCEFEGSDAARNLADLQWLTPRVLAHESLVSALSTIVPIYPARFGCLFSSAIALSHFLRAHHETLGRYFASVGSKREWGLKLVANLDLASEALAKEALKAEGQTSAGVNYLKLKQWQKKYRGQALSMLEVQCEWLIAQLRQRFPDSQLRNLMVSASPDRERVVANIALLLDDHMAQELAEWEPITDAAGNVFDSLELRRSGPWPPYSFCPSLPAAA